MADLPEGDQTSSWKWREWFVWHHLAQSVLSSLVSVCLNFCPSFFDLFRRRTEPACTRLAKPFWGTTGIWTQGPCRLPRGRSSTDRFTRRALTPARAAKRRATPDTTPTKRATRRWATPRRVRAPDRNPLDQTTRTPSLSWRSLFKWKTRRSWVPTITPPRILRGSAAAWRAPPSSCTLPKPPNRDMARPASLSALLQLERHHLYLVCLLTRGPCPDAHGIRKSAAASERRCALASDLPQEFVWMFVITFLFPVSFIQLSTCLPVFGVCPKPKLTHDEC